MMFTRRNLIVGFGVSLIGSATPAWAGKRKSGSSDPKFFPQIVEFSGFEPESIVIDAKNHFLYFTFKDGMAKRYGIGVGAGGRGLRGVAEIGRKAKWPAWRPTGNMIRRNPRKYARYARGVPGGPKNPLGARALYLYRGSRDTMFRIHGTNEPWSIGRSVSNGCIRMYNESVIDLYDRVPIGTKVIML